ncbi:MAG: trehalose-phosphatase [Gammaproteobacteria bacterium]|nr:trehalose-phosphatase [Gammaproteobacteria bacterium]
MNEQVYITPELFDAVIFDMDGVVTDTAEAHEAAWKKMFDSYLKKRSERDGRTYDTFKAEDYLQHLDGKPRYDGVRDFLASRGIELPWGDPGDDTNMDTVCGLGNRKNRYFNEWLQNHTVRAYPDALRFIHTVRELGIKTAVISSSKNSETVLKSAGANDLFDVRVDGTDMAQLGLPGKPDPAIFIQAAQRLQVSPERSAMFEDALAGVEAGARGSFALVVGVDHSEAGQHHASLHEHGAEVVVADLCQLLSPEHASETARPLDSVPVVWQCKKELDERLRRYQVAVFLDYDGTLTPIVEDYKKARLDQRMRDSIAELAEHYPVAIISGRDLSDVRERVGLDSIFYAGSHGFDIAGPEGFHKALQQGQEYLPDLDDAEKQLREAVKNIKGAVIERKTFSIAMHYRQVSENNVGAVENAVDTVLDAHERLRKSGGKKIFELQPKIKWDKGHAVLWLLEQLNLDRPEVLPLYIGDDVTDEDAFKMLRRQDRGIGVVVRDGETRTTSANYALDEPEDVRRFLEMLIKLDKGVAHG